MHFDQNDVAVNNFIASQLHFIHFFIIIFSIRIKNIQRIEVSSSCDQMISEHIINHHSFHKIKMHIYKFKKSVQIILLI